MLVDRGEHTICLKSYTYLIAKVSNINKPGWNPIKKSDDRAAGVRFFLLDSRVRTELDDTKSHYELIIKITISD